MKEIVYDFPRSRAKNAQHVQFATDVLAAVKPLEAKYKVYSYPCGRKIVDSDVITTKKTYNGQESETSKFFMRLETTYRFVNTEDPADFCETTTYGDGVDSNDKAPGKAMTYADKYALLKAYKIITGDDPDQDKSEDGKITFKQAKKMPLCEECGNPIAPFRKGGEVVKTAEEMAEGAREKYGKVLCLQCMRKLENETDIP